MKSRNTRRLFYDVESESAEPGRVIRTHRHLILLRLRSPPGSLQALPQRNHDQHSASRQSPAPRDQDLVVSGYSRSIARKTSSSFPHQHQEMMEMSSTSSAPSPCAKGCGFFGSPSTLNMYSVCFTKHLLATAPAAAPSSKEAIVEKTTADVEAAAPAALTLAEIQQKAWRERVKEAAKEKYFENRCTCCMKKMGIAGRFQCRCGKVYCINHMHPEMHACTFDYQRAGRISIRSNNPLIEGQKLRDRI